ncbi:MULTISPECIES: toxic anion resistance protein [unclassified Fusibacter]|uniref:toxic anion resistance protein n=1 Tax=unclassified Fusibacter TaxID=2624464 RepID=UPI0010122478|nr:MULTISPECIES: toxic anion resistance protein [unclassified Fusibacter]MCK8058236.1 toxic anion resistance protein [Fusibacter sp. A2]NPE20819.1 toxic anion resistance protein [Fusibacter sp. A1]RXV63023.1 toxic anion resistance protein [Fusibacter sp. A1]
MTTEPKYEIDIVKTETEVQNHLMSSPEVLALTKHIDARDPNTILKFGYETANEISKFSDQILDTMRMTKVEDSGSLLIQLNKIMDKFDIDDFEEEKPNFFEKIFNKSKNMIDALFAKYNTMGTEVDKVYQQLKSYENEINQSNGMLEEMFNKNMEYFEMLTKYALAGKMFLDEFNNKVIPELEAKAQTSGQQLDTIQYNNALQVAEMMDQRLYDLELAKTVSLQTMPQIKLIQKGNYNLVRKINSAFIITLPIFKQCLTQAITLKRQAAQAEAMQALDDKTNELLLRNAQNTASQSVKTAHLASKSSIDIETLEKSWQVIKEGIEETKRIQAEAKEARVAGTERLHAIQDEFKSKSRLS